MDYRNALKQPIGKTDAGMSGGGDIIGEAAAVDGGDRCGQKSEKGQEKDCRKRPETKPGRRKMPAGALQGELF